MKVLITGSNGFIGKNLRLKLSYLHDIEVVSYDIFNTPEELGALIERADFIFHLAGVNRPTKREEFYSGNAGLTKQLADLLKAKKRKIPVLFCSSIHAALDNDYGRSKRQAEETLKDLAKMQPVFIYRLANVFGKWCKPNYNSAVATFCHNISHGLPVTINDPNSEISLVYIDDVVDEFTNVLLNGRPTARPSAQGIYSTRPIYQITVDDLVKRLESYWEDVRSISVPTTGDDLTRKLFSTLISYVEPEDLVVRPIIHADERGSFVELVRTQTTGQISLSTSIKGVARGGHYHDTKMERFVVAKGRALIKLRHMDTNALHVFEVGDEKHEIVNIPVGYTHSIENLSNELILFIWCNELFDPERPDTHIAKV